jgi:hypothetical protein
LDGRSAVASPLPTHRTAQTQNKRTQTFTHHAGFEPTILMFERAKTINALDRAATKIGNVIVCVRTLARILNKKQHSNGTINIFLCN